MVNKRAPSAQEQQALTKTFSMQKQKAFIACLYVGARKHDVTVAGTAGCGSLHQAVALPDAARVILAQAAVGFGFRVFIGFMKEWQASMVRNRCHRIHKSVHMPPLNACAPVLLPQQVVQADPRPLLRPRVAIGLVVLQGEGGVSRFHAFHDVGPWRQQPPLVKVQRHIRLHSPQQRAALPMSPRMGRPASINGTQLVHKKQKNVAISQPVAALAGTVQQATETSSILQNSYPVH